MCALPGKFQCSTQPGSEGRQWLHCQGCPWLTPLPSPHPEAAQQAPQAYGGWSVTQLCHSPMDCANTLSQDDKHTSRRRTRKINLRNHELCVLPPHTNTAFTSLFCISSLPDYPSFSPKPGLKSFSFFSPVTPYLTDTLFSSSVTDQHFWHL